MTVIDNSRLIRHPTARRQLARRPQHHLHRVHDHTMPHSLSQPRLQLAVSINLAYVYRLYRILPTNYATAAVYASRFYPQSTIPRAPLSNLATCMYVVCRIYRSFRVPSSLLKHVRLPPLQPCILRLRPMHSLLPHCTASPVVSMAGSGGTHFLASDSDFEN